MNTEYKAIGAQLATPLDQRGKSPEEWMAHVWARERFKIATDGEIAHWLKNLPTVKSVSGRKA